MSKILAKGMITLTQLYEGAQVILTPAVVLIPCNSEETPKPNAYINASTNVKAFLGTMDITSGITLGELEYSDSTVRASKTGTKVSITTITTRTGYVDIPVSATINGETIDLGKHRFNFVKQIDGQTGQPGAPGDPGFGYTLNIKGGTRGIAYAANGTNPEPKTSSQFSVELLKNGVKVANPASISWTCGGNLSGSSSAATFTPTIKSTYASESSYVKVSVKEFAASLAVEETIPIICTKHADGLDWINEWNSQYVQVGTEKIITPKIFAGTKNSANELTGVAIGRDVLGGNANKVIGIVGYKKNTPVFSLDQDANFFVSSSGSAGDIKNGTNNAKGIYFDGNNLYVSGKVKISGGSTIGENNTLVEDVINNSNLGVQANNKLDNLSIGGRNLIRKANLGQNNSTATYDEATNTWTVNATAGAGGTWGCGLVINGKNVLVPYGKSYVLSFEIKVPRACSWNSDVNNYAITGSSWAGNDNDVTSKRTTSSKSLAANQWIKCWVKWENTNPNNTNKVDIYDNSNFGVVMKDETSNMTYQIRNVKGELGNVPTEWTPAPEDIDLAINNQVNNAITGLKVGGNNLLRNGNFAYDMANWSTHDMNSGGTNKSVVIGSGGSWIPEGKKAIVIRGTNTTDRYGVISSTMKLTPNTKYTISGYCAGHRVNRIQVNVRDVQNSHANIHAIDIKPVQGGNTLDKWYKFETTFTTTANSEFALNLYSINLGDNGYVWFTDVQVQEGTKATAWTPCSEDVNSNINDVKNSLSNFQTTVNTTFKDGIIEEAEAKAIAQHLKTLDAEKADIDKEYSTIYSNANLTGSAKTNLANAKTSFDSAHANLKSTINTVISDGRVSSSESASVTSTFNTYNTQLGTYKQRVQEALDNISSAKINGIQIGGRNFLLNSTGNLNNTQHWGSFVLDTTKTFEGCNSFKLTRTNFTNGSSRFQGSQTIFSNKLNLTVNDCVTVSGWIYIDSSVALVNSNNDVSLRNYYSENDSFEDLCIFNYTNSPKNKWVKFSATSKLTKNPKRFQLLVSLAGNGLIWVSKLKVEKGTKATDWTPAPEDIDAEITAVNNKAQDSINKLTELASDSKLTASEKLVVKREWDAIVGEKTKITSEADKFGVSKTDYESKYNTLNSYITPLLSNLTTTSDINGSTFRSNFTNYYNSRQDLLNAITTKVKTLADNAQSTANTANNTANTVNTTVNNNKNNWSNAYNRVVEWASGAVTGSTNINGGMIATDTITAKQLAIGDFNNYSQLVKGKNLVNRHGTANWVEGTNGHSYWQTTNAFFPFTVSETLNPFKAGDKIQIKFDAYTPSTRNVNVGVWFFSDTSASSNIGSVAGAVSCSASWGTKTVNLTLPTGNTYVQNAKSIAILIHNGSSGERIEVRNATVNRLVAGDLIVNGTITTDHIHTNGLNANVIKAGTISADRLDANTIVSKVNGGTTEINGNRIQTGTLSASKITTGTLDANKVNVTNLNASNIKSGTIDASKISVTNLNASSITSGTLGGGYNLLKNSKAQNGTNFWLNNGGGISTATHSTYKTCFKTQAPSGMKYHESIKLKNNTEYVYEGCFFSETAISGSSAVPLHYWCMSTANTAGQSQLTVLDYRQSVPVNRWTKCYVHFRTASSGDVYFTPFVYVGGSATFNFWATELSLSENSVESRWTPHPSEIYEGSTIIDATGVTVNNGALRVKNKSGTTVLSGDSNGNLVLAGSITSNATIKGGTIVGSTLKSNNGDMLFDMNNGYMLLYNNGTKIAQTNKNSVAGTSIYGVSNGAEYGSYACLSAKVSSSASNYQMMITASGRDLPDANLKKGVNLGNTFNSNNWHFNLGSSTQLTWRQNGSNHDSFITEGSDGMLRLFGDNGMFLGYRNGNTNTFVIAIRENGSHTYPKSLSVFDDGVRPATDNNGYSLEISAPLNMKGQSINQCSNIKTLGLEFIEPIAFNRNREGKTRTLKVTKNTQNIVEFIGSTAIKNGEAIVDLPSDVSFKNYVVLLTPIGLDRKVSIIEKNDDNFKIVGDDGIVDYVIKFESMDYANYIRKSISEDNTDIIVRSEEDKPKEIFVEN